MEVILAKTAGFCFGVKRAVDTVYKEAGKKNVYTYGPIIHNSEVVNDLKKKGVEVLRIPGIAVNDFSGSSSDSVLKYKDRLLTDNLADNNISREVDSDIIEEKQKEVISLSVLMKELGSRKIDGILLEGGGQLNESALQAGIVQRVYCYIAPKIFGGAQAKTPVEGQGLAKAADAWHFTRIGMQEFGQDILLEYERTKEN